MRNKLSEIVQTMYYLPWNTIRNELDNDQFAELLKLLKYAPKYVCMHTNILHDTD